MSPSGKWRPPLWLVLFGGLGATLGMSVAGLVALRLAGPEIGFRNAALVVAVAIAAATAVLGWFLARLILGPVTALSRHAVSLTAGRRDEPPPVRFGTSELSALGSGILAMAETLRRREAAVRAFADHATHELKTPMATIRAAGELLADVETLTPPDRALLARLLDGCAQIERQLAALRRVARAREPAHQGTTTLAQVAPTLEADALAIDVAGGRDLPIPLAAEGLRIVLQEIARNAEQHGAARLVLRADDAPRRRLVAEDDGPGVSPGHADRVFDPFFTSRRETGGTGMGLAIAAALLSAHGASIDLRPSERGARFEMSFAG